MSRAKAHGRIDRRVWIVATLGFVGLSCELDEIVVPEGDPIVLVQGIMRPDLDQQWILVEQSLTGEARGFSGPFIPRDGPDIPIEGALVTVTNRSRAPANDPCGGAVTFLESATPLDPATPGVYWSPQGCPVMAAGDSLELRVEFNGTVVIGRTEVPGADALLLRAGNDSVLIPGPALVLNRDTDTLEVEVRATHGRAIQLEVQAQTRLGSSSPFARGSPTTFWVDSTTMTLPGNVVNVFEGDFDDDFVPDLFVAGQYYDITVALTDNNFFDFLRSANSPLSGRGFINRLDGGFGLFGSLTAGTNVLEVIASIDDQREGTYRLTGTIDSVAVEVEFELYVGQSFGETDLFSAFTRGTWVHGPLDQGSAGELAGPQMQAFLVQAVPDSLLPGTDLPFLDEFTLSGRLADSGTFSVTVRDNLSLNERGSLAGVKVK